MIKFRLYFDKDKETEWLNGMAERGYAMTGFFAAFYKFEKCEPGEWEYQIDFGSKLFAVADDYREFMESAGIEVIQPWGFWIILRRKKMEEPFQLYTDVDSSIEHYKKIRTMFKVATVLELICFMAEAFCAASGADIGYWFMLLLAVIIIALMRALAKTNRVIAELKERKGEVSVKKNEKIDPLLISGLLLNSCALVLEYDTPLLYGVKIVLQVAAIILMLVGIYRTRWVFCSK